MDRRLLATNLFNLRVEDRAAATLSKGAFHLTPAQERLDLSPPRPAARRRLWELHKSLHCSIIGTCLSTTELRKLLTRAGIRTEDKSDHELHGQGVSLSAQSDSAGKLLNKLLDERHNLSVKKYGRAKTEEEVRKQWLEDVKAGDIPGAYWATMTHPETTESLQRQAFGHVHMLSHLVGAANRADIRQLQKLQEENSQLRKKSERQQASFHAEITRRDTTIQELQNALAKKLTSGRMEPSAAQEDERSYQKLVTELERQADASLRRRLSAEDRLAKTKEELETSKHTSIMLERKLDDVVAELTALHRVLENQDLAQAPSFANATLKDTTILYVGGRPNQIPHIRDITETRGGKFLHHDGGVEDNELLLGSLVAKANIVVFPVDCVSHKAMTLVKKSCRSSDTRYLPLRSSAASTFFASLERFPPSAPN